MLCCLCKLMGARRDPHRPRVWARALAIAGALGVLASGGLRAAQPQSEPQREPQRDPRREPPSPPTLDPQPGTTENPGATPRAARAAELRQQWMARAAAKDYAGACDALEALIALTPEDFISRYNLVRVRIAAGRLELAEGDAAATTCSAVVLPASTRMFTVRRPWLSVP